MINDPTLYTKHITDGVATSFLIGMEYMFDEDNIKVTYFDGDTDEEYELTLGVNYTVDTVAGTIITQTGAYSGGTLVSPIVDSAVTGLSKLTITLNAEYTQKNDIISNSNYDPELLESGFDKNTILAKQNKERLNRAISLAISDAGSEMTLPPIADLSNGVLAFDENGEPIARAGFIPESYDNSYTYSTDDLIQDSGKFFIALQSTTGNSPVGGSADVYWKMLNFDGINWDATIYFNTGDIVEYGGVLYKSVGDDNINHTPSLTDFTYWEFTSFQDINPYNSTSTYPLDAIVTSLGLMYISLESDNFNNTPASTPLSWKIWPEASNIAIEDIAGIITADNVEDALAENRGETNTHKTSTGEDHSYIDQDVSSNVTPKFTGLNLYDGVGTADRQIDFDSDASLLWDEGADEFYINKPIEARGFTKEVVADTGTLIASKDTEVFVETITYTEVATFTAKVRGSLQLYAQHLRAGGAGTCYIRFLRNGVQLQEFGNTTVSYVAKTYDMTDFEPGDVITWEVRGSTNLVDAYIRYCRVYGSTITDSIDTDFEVL